MKILCIERYRFIYTIILNKTYVRRIIEMRRFKINFFQIIKNT